MKTIREHWESLPNRKLGEWLMKQPLDSKLIGQEFTDGIDALRSLNWKVSDAIKECYKTYSWQPLLDALPELREDDHVGNVTEMVQQQQDTRRAEVVQLVAAILSADDELGREQIGYIVTSAIMLQAEIDKQLNQHHEKE